MSWLREIFDHIKALFSGVKRHKITIGKGIIVKRKKS